MSLGFILNSNGQGNQILKFGIDLADSISVGMKDIQIQLRVENISSEAISIKNPSHWGNAYPFVEHKGIEIPLIKVKVNPEHFNDTVRLEPQQVFTVKFDYTLDKLLKLESLAAGSYEMFFRLQGNPPIESNILTFYKE